MTEKRSFEISQATAFFVEMAGVEPASERIGPQKSTSVVGRNARFGAITKTVHERQGTRPASRQGSKAPLSHG